VNTLFDPATWNVAITVLTVCLIIVFYIRLAGRGYPVNVRKPDALAMMPDTIAQAVAADRPVLFVPGSRDLDNIQTVTAMNLLADVARQVAEIGGRLLVPTNRSMVMDTAREICAEAWRKAGREAEWDRSWVNYISDDPLGYVARVEGMIAREKPGATLLMGSFASESLLLAEGGYQVGSIQISGSASPVQLPFLVASCDSTLIGEEFFAAGAVTGGNPSLLGSVRGQDVCKYGAIILIVGGSLIFTLAGLTGWAPLHALADFLDALLRSG
jgi:Domain of unknown function (DUF6754)